MKLSTLLLLVVLMITAACGTTPSGSNADPQAAQGFLPKAEGAFAGYQVTNAASITDAITAAAGQGADALGNPAIQTAITRIDSFISCYNQVGAVAANIYTQVDLGSVIGGDLIPSAGAIAVVNQDRVRENLLACAAGSDEGFSAASAPTTCQGSGNFSSGGNQFTYVYISTKDDFCNATRTHFAQYGG